ncbi:hypothetical protein TNIN_135041 [Trichonephila inaurata madagascariensis]|uniref:Uncharacterized protein n=1 Tax=Trichonephila inaurata madagascariensis TaxID=2747483 RepID=A0A8X6Y1G1_9ARAC|nr:hypothetical protein TNIN_135041 [Trichonephila inaurata madagascariensis]
MSGRPKLNNVGFDSMFEKPGNVGRGQNFTVAWKDVWGIVQRYLRETWVVSHYGKTRYFGNFCREMERFGIQCVMLPFWRVSVRWIGEE